MKLILNLPFLVFVLSFVALVVSAQIGDALRKKVRPLQEDGGNDFGVVLTGTLTLLGLIIGFSISMAISRYDLRKNYEQGEANAIAIEYVRADLLPAVDGTKLRELLKTYLDLRAIATVPPPQQGVVISGMNDVVLSQRSTQAAWWNRIPVSLWALLVVISIGCNFLIGYRARRTDWLVFLIMPVAVSISFFLISDLDSPRGGAIRVAPQNLISLSAISAFNIAQFKEAQPEINHVASQVVHRYLLIT